jgi:uncharacterized protein (DUF1330 family)
MAAYVVVSVDITDPEKFKAYQALVPATLEKYGGRYLARGGQKTQLEGNGPAGRIVVIEFGSVDEAQRWYGSAEYKEAIAARAGAATLNMVAVEGV